MKPHTYLTAGEAARATGKTVPTITRAIKNGRISGVTRGENKEYQIDPIALFNVYPRIEDAKEKNSSVTPYMQDHVTPLIDTAYSAAIDALKETISAKDALINEKEEIINDYKKRLAKSENLLTDQRSEADKIKVQTMQSESLLNNQKPEIDKINEYKEKLEASDRLIQENQIHLEQLKAELEKAKSKKSWWRWWK